MQTIIGLFSIVIIGLLLYKSFGKKKKLQQPAIETEREILSTYVLFYKRLSEPEKLRFEKELRGFLDNVQITGVNTTADDTDRVFIAAAAIIPIFAFNGWQYRNIHEVLLYPDAFDKDYNIAGGGRDTLGVVGDGALQNVMILSQQDLRNGFLNTSDKSNTAIHEFVHLVDKSDGATDGLPGISLPHSYSAPWIKRMHQEIQLIKAGKSDINPYGATNEAEFFAVASEYFFEQPHRMEEKHPELFALMKQAFKTPV